MEPVAHGGDLHQVQLRFPKAPLPWIDLSTGINPFPYPVPALSPRSWTRLPSRADQSSLRAAAARRYRVNDPTTLVAAPGTQALIQLLPRLFARSRVAVLGPTYEEHELCWRRQGHEVTVVASLDEAAQADVVVAVNPNNPTGRLLPASELRRLKGWRVIDEAFIDFEPAGASLAADPPPKTVVLRSFGKTYGLAGLRLGFAIADRPLADRLAAELGPWAVSGAALEIGRAALSDDAWLGDAAGRLAAARNRLDRLLLAAGFDLAGGTPLFRLAAHPEAGAIVDTLGRQGIHVRAFARQPTWLRFGLPAGDGEFARLADALAQFRTEGRPVAASSHTR